MKKLLTKFLAAIAVCLLLGTGNTKAWYWCIAGDDVSNWNLQKEGCWITAEHADTYVINIPKLSGNFKIVKFGDNLNDASYKGYNDFDPSKIIVSPSPNFKITEGATNGNMTINKVLYNVKISLEITGQHGDNIASVKFEGTEREPSEFWAIKGNFFRDTTWDLLYFKRENNSSCIWTTEFTPLKANGSFGIAQMNVNQNQDAWFYNSTNTILRENSTIKLYNQKSGGSGNPGFQLNKDQKYYLTLNTHTMELSISSTNSQQYPEKLYVYGHLNNNYWNINNYEELLPIPGKPGHYQIDKLNVEGKWSASDEKDSNGQHIEGTDTENENYIAFFDHLVTDMSNQGARYGSVPSFKPGNVTIPGDKEENLQVTNELFSDNFEVFEGVYNVELDLVNMKVKFTEVKVDNVEYIWYNSNDELQLTDDGIHTFTFGDGSDDIIQVAVNDNPTHKVARQAELEVWYRAPQYNTPKGIKSRLGISTDDPESQGYSIANEEGENPDIQRNGSSAYGDNHTIKLLKAGDYIINASLTDEENQHETIKENYNVEPTSLAISVAQANVTLSAGGDPSTLFSSSTKKQAETVAGAFKVENSTTQMTLGTDYTISIKPNTTEYQGWMIPTEEVTEQAIYQSLPGYNADQESSTSLYHSYYETSKDSKIDGVYTGVEDLTAEYNNGVYDIKGSFPCSGVYTLTVTPVENGNFSFEEFSTDITIFPNLYNVYSGIPGFNVNGYGFADGSTDVPVISYLQEGNVAWQPKDNNGNSYSFAYTPGLFFAKSLDINTSGLTSISPDGSDPLGEDNKLAIKRNATSGDTNYYGGSLSLDGKGDGTLEATIVKNGASAKYQFNLKLTTEVTVPTGVDTVEAAGDSEAEFFNLQGVKVANPEHGIFIKIQNGKAVKVVR